MDCDVTYDSDGRLVGDKELFAIMREAMKVLSFTPDDKANILACVLHLGNIEFGGTSPHPLLLVSINCIARHGVLTDHLLIILYKLVMSCGNDQGSAHAGLGWPGTQPSFTAIQVILQKLDLSVSDLSR